MTASTQSASGVSASGVSASGVSASGEAAGIQFTSSTTQLTLVALFGVLLLLYLIIGRKMHAFVALLLTSVIIGLAARYPEFDPELVLSAMQQGMGSTLGFVAVVVGLGAMFGRMLEISGGAQVLAEGLLARFGQRRAGWAMSVAGFLISIPVFFDVALVVLMPMLHGLARKAGAPLMRFALPLMAGMVVTHAFVPPTPGPIGVAAILGADLGTVIALGILVGIPATLLAGPVLVRFVEVRVPGKLPDAPVPRATDYAGRPPRFSVVLGLLGLPNGLILLGTASHAWLGDSSSMRAASVVDVLQFLGHPFVSLLIATLSCVWLLGRRRGLPAERVHDVVAGALEPAGIIILVTGAGGVLKQVMIESEVGKALAEQLAPLGVTPLVLAFLLAWVMRVMQGSATVAMLTAAGLIVPLLEQLQPSAALRALLVLAIASGATCTSHVNDSGFWLVSRYLGLSTEETLRSWTLMTTVIGVTGLAMVLLLSLILH